MAKNTNFQNLKALLEEYEPETKGFLSGKEHDLISERLEIESMDIIRLHNLRDFVVIYLANKSKPEEMNSMLDDMDRMSAITAVIDQAIINKGGEV